MTEVIGTRPYSRKWTEIFGTEEQKKLVEEFTKTFGFLPEEATPNIIVRGGNTEIVIAGSPEDPGELRNFLRRLEQLIVLFKRAERR